MTQIEAAAREIVNRFDNGNSMPLNVEVESRLVTEIITRHLFPVVKAEDCDRKRLYYYKSSDGTWTIDDGTWAKLLDDIAEIRGPIPLPEVRS